MNGQTTETTESATPAATATETPEKKATSRATKPHVAPAKGTTGKKATSAKKAPKTATKATARAKSAKPAKDKGPREGSKSERILALLRRADGTTLKELMKATGWQAHSVRGFLSAAVGKKLSLKVQSLKEKDGERTYSLKG